MRKRIFPLPEADHIVRMILVLLRDELVGIRRMAGYGRNEIEEELRALNQLYVNFFQPRGNWFRGKDFRVG